MADRLTLPAEERLARRWRPLVGAPEDALVVHEVYASVQGESSYAGLPCVFIRTTACNLRCRWCDTAHAFMRGEPMGLEELVARVRAFGPRLVELTGGEPLMQPASLPLMSRLCDLGYRVLLETSGSLDIGAVDARVVRIVDFKAPGSGEVESNRYENVGLLRPSDEVKLVLADRADYEWAKALMAEHALASRCTVLLSAVHGELPTSTLVAWMLEDRLPARLNFQLHKAIWAPQTRGV